MDNTLIKITDGAVRSSVLVLDNVPNPYFGGGRRTVQENIALRSLRVDYAVACLQRIGRLEQERADYSARLAAHGISTPRHLDTSNAFLRAVQQSIIQTGGTPTHKKERYHSDNYAKRRRQRTDAIWDIVHNNFSPNNTAFATLTFDPSTTKNTDNLNVAARYFRNFIIRVNKRYDDFLYLAVYARQQNGRWHFHLLYNAPSITRKTLMAIWKYGSVRTTRTLNRDAVRHKTQYLLKNLHQNEDELMGRKGYSYSQNLRRSTVLKSWREGEADDCIDRFNQLSQCQNKYLVYDKERVTGSLVRLDYPDGTVQEVFISEADQLQTEAEFNIVDDVVSHTSAVVVYHNEGENDFITATLKSK